MELFKKCSTYWNILQNQFNIIAHVCKYIRYNIQYKMQQREQSIILPWEWQCFLWFGYLASQLCISAILMAENTQMIGSAVKITQSHWSLKNHRFSILIWHFNFRYHGYISYCFTSVPTIGWFFLRIFTIDRNKNNKHAKLKQKKVFIFFLIKSARESNEHDVNEVTSKKLSLLKC